jgi:hypothetical protein
VNTREWNYSFACILLRPIEEANIFRRILVVVYVVVLTGSASVGTAAAAGGPLCRNYVVNTPFGRFTTDVRPRGVDPIGTVSWALFINVLADVPGEYSFQEFVNGKPISALKTQLKTDNLHQVFYRVENGVTRYNHGDTIHVNVDHEANGNIYITPINRCTVP